MYGCLRVDVPETIEPLNLFKRAASVRCPVCGTEKLYLRASRDKIDRMYQTPARRLQQLLGARLYHCWVCRIQFYDMGELAAPAAEAAPEPAAVPAAAPAVVAAPAPRDGTVIGETVLIKGSVSSAENFSLHGSIEGPIAIPAHRLTIGRAGRLRGNVQAGEVAAAGTVRGNLEARSRVALGATASVIGDIRAASLSIAEGAYCRGKIETRER
jgi:cytoskeletal protein CcmA (bactofilin family)